MLAYCLQTNHWHFVVWPEREGELTAFSQWLTHTHTMRWHAHYHTQGNCRVYQGRFKSFPVQDDKHFFRVVRNVERNALRANLVQRAEDWRLSSLWRRHRPDAKPLILLTDWPLPMPANLLDLVKMKPESKTT